MRGYAIGTGWWCDGTGHQMGAGRNKSTDEIRKENFFYLWNRYIQKFTNPEAIIVIDSASPVKPKLEYQRNSEKFIWHTLAENPGHGKGWHRGVLDSAKKAMALGLHYVYVEQDCLVYGEGWVEKCIEHAKNTSGILLGRGTGTPQPLQQSLIVVVNGKLEEFIDGIYKYEGDAGVPNEVMFDKNLNWSYLPIDGGRSRPIPFNQKYWYAQHFTSEELQTAKDHLERICVGIE